MLRFSAGHSSGAMTKVGQMKRPRSVPARRSSISQDRTHVARKSGSRRGACPRPRRRSSRRASGLDHLAATRAGTPHMRAADELCQWPRRGSLGRRVRRGRVTGPFVSGLPPKGLTLLGRCSAESPRACEGPTTVAPPVGLSRFPRTWGPPAGGEYQARPQLLGRRDLALRDTTEVSKCSGPSSSSLPVS
jgi:hypothetical protein